MAPLQAEGREVKFTRPMERDRRIDCADGKTDAYTALSLVALGRLRLAVIPFGKNKLALFGKPNHPQFAGSCCAQLFQQESLLDELPLQLLPLAHAQTQPLVALGDAAVWVGLDVLQEHQFQWK